MFQLRELDLIDPNMMTFECACQGEEGKLNKNFLGFIIIYGGEGGEI